MTGNLETTLNSFFSTASNVSNIDNKIKVGNKNSKMAQFCEGSIKYIKTTTSAGSGVERLDIVAIISCWYTNNPRRLQTATYSSFLATPLMHYIHLVHFIPAQGRPTHLDYSRARAYGAVGAGGGCLDIFSLIYNFSFLSPSLWETVRYKLKYCLKGPLSTKQSTNQPTFYKPFLCKT